MGSDTRIVFGYKIWVQIGKEVKKTRLLTPQLQSKSPDMKQICSFSSHRNCGDCAVEKLQNVLIKLIVRKTTES